MTREQMIDEAARRFVHASPYYARAAMEIGNLAPLDIEEIRAEFRRIAQDNSMPEIKNAEDAENYLRELRKRIGRERRFVTETNKKIKRLQEEIEYYEGHVGIVRLRINQLSEEIERWRPAVEKYLIEREQWIVRQRDSGVSFAGLARQLGISTSRVSQIYYRAQRKKAA